MKRLFIAVLLLFPLMAQATVLLQSRDGTIGAGYTSPEPGFGVKVSFDSDVVTLGLAYRYQDFKFWAGGEKYDRDFVNPYNAKICVKDTCSIIQVRNTYTETKYGADLGVGYYISNVFVFASYGTATETAAVGIGYGF